jgi:hypothetical protein
MAGPVEGQRQLSHLRRLARLYATDPALARWAKLCRAYGALTAPIRRDHECLEVPCGLIYRTEVDCLLRELQFVGAQPGLVCATQN